MAWLLGEIYDLQSSSLFPINRARRVCRTVEKIVARVRVYNMEVPGQEIPVESRRRSGGVGAETELALAQLKA